MRKLILGIALLASVLTIAQNNFFNTTSETEKSVTAYHKIAAGVVTIYNETGKDIYIYEDGSRNGTRINVNSRTSVDCTSDYTYKFDSNAGGSGISCYKANAHCGGSITIE